jgi:hypothetical protein
MQRSQALMLVRATTRLKILADRARARTAARAAEAAAEAEAGSHDDTQLHADGIDHCAYHCTQRGTYLARATTA